MTFSLGSPEGWQPHVRERVPAEHLRVGDRILYPGAGQSYNAPIPVVRLVFDEHSDTVEIWPGPWRVVRSTILWVDLPRPPESAREIRPLGKKRKRRS